MAKGEGQLGDCGTRMPAWFRNRPGESLTWCSGVKVPDPLTMSASLLGHGNIKISLMPSSQRPPVAPLWLSEVSRLLAVRANAHYGGGGGGGHWVPQYRVGPVLNYLGVGSRKWSFVLDWILSGSRSNSVPVCLKSYVEARKNDVRLKL